MNKIWVVFALLASLTSFAKDHALFDRLAELQSANQHFVDGKPAHPDQDTKYRSELAKGQKPHTVVLSCSDSRVPPELVFDQGLGDLFVVRTAGHVLSPGAIGSIEYAIEHLHAHLIVVLGHESCGAVKATLETPPGKSSGSPNIDSIIASIRPSIKGVKVDAEDKTLRAPVKANVSATAKELTKKSKIIREGVEKGELMIAQGIYSLSTGKVDFWDAGTIESPQAPKKEH